MSKIVLSLVTVAALIFVGCGGGDSDSVDINKATLEYKTAATYDIRDYMVPLENSINVYSDDTYFNDKGDKSFKEDPESDTYTEKYDINGTQIIVRDGQDVIDSEYTIKSDRIVKNDDLTDTDIVRFADIGDYILKIDRTITENNIPIKNSEVCKLIKYHDTKEFNNKSYNDVLELSCTGVNSGSANSGVFSVEYNAEITSTIYFSKSNGMVYSEDITCESTKTTVNGTDSENKTCEKEIEQLLSHNKL